ncbi:hypothetical protein [Pannonibacter sp. SL95]|uniref:hypothetical protein n=1 Tax=Pannonibacter sp. SL95 TaxID=2995153 RepID=UPI002272D0FA|nr:hypothetical protein [Pannonibacter sp. SL95]MCY1708366.1 hypothetical protein [Pannonibacter sp. SL95]
MANRSNAFVGTSLQARRLPPISQEVLDELSKTFPAPTIEPGFDRDKAIWQAAQAEVVAYLKQWSSRGSVLGTEPEKPDDKPKTPVNLRYGE